MHNSHFNAPTRHRDRDPLIAGLVLISIGAIMLAVQIAPELGRSVVLLVGLGLLAIFLVTRSYGALIGGSIMTGLGTGIVLTSMVSGTEAGAVVLLSLGAGFLAIWPLAILFQLDGRHWWPLIPGGILVSVGAALWIGGRAVELLAYWPVVLIVIGVALVGVRLWRPPSASEES